MDGRVILLSKLRLWDRAPLVLEGTTDEPIDRPLATKPSLNRRFIIRGGVFKDD